MRDQPDGAQLLDMAQRLMREQLLPIIPAEHHYTALMVARAMAIASRQLHADPRLEEIERMNLANLLGETGDLRFLNKLFVQRIRAGSFANDAAVFDHLWKTSLARVRESNPKYVERSVLFEEVNMRAPKP